MKKGKKLEPGVFVEVICKYEYKATADLKYTLGASSKPIYHSKYKGVITNCGSHLFVTLLCCLDCANETNSSGNIKHKYEKFGPGVACFKDDVKIIEPSAGNKRRWVDIQ